MKLANTLGDVAASVGVGVLAGLAGTAAMTVWDRPARRRTRGSARGYGTSWGTVRGLFDIAGLGGPAAAGAHLGAVWAGEQVVLPVTGASSLGWTWGTKELVIDLFRHVVYAAATSPKFRDLDRLVGR